MLRKGGYSLELLKDKILASLDKDKLDLFGLIKEGSELYKNMHQKLHKDQAVLDIVEKALTIPTTVIDDLLKDLAERIVDDKLEVEDSVSEYVYNVNNARSQIISWLCRLSENWPDRYSIVDKINHAFDTFLYHVITIFETEEKNAEPFVSDHKDRLTLLGRMTSTFVHEFRNPLTSIRGFIQLLKADHPNLPYLDIISGELDELNFRISQFLVLSKKELIEREVSRISLNKLLEQVLSFLYPHILEIKVDIHKEIEKNLYVSGSEEELRQVIVNIFFNAFDALSAKDEKRDIQITANKEEDNTIKINISNNGPKIPDRLLKTLFKPFVSSKKTGTGLGLFVCKEIIEKHEGTLTCTSNEKWTTFSILLPEDIETEKSEN